MTQASPDQRPLVVLFRPMPLDRDTRAKKFAATLARAGYRVTILAPVETGADTATMAMGDVAVIPVTVSTRHRDAVNRKTVVLRQARPRLLTREDAESYVTRVRERKLTIRKGRARSARLKGQIAPTPEGLVAAAKWTAARGGSAVETAALKAMRGRWGAQDRLNKAIAGSWRAFDRKRRDSILLATTDGALPEIRDYADAFAPVLDRLAPDVIHAHHPFILRTAVRAARRRRADGHACAVVYDARENFAGIPKGEQGSPRRHGVLVAQEADAIRSVNRVITVSEPIADELQARYRLARRPSVVLNVPVRSGQSAAQTLREVVGLRAEDTLLVYSGGISAARGLETLIEAMGSLDGIHLAIVPVPHPHPSIPTLLRQAEQVGAAGRVHVAAPVPQPDIPTYLASADVAVHPMPGGSPNHDQAMPNKLFEYLHAGLPLVVSDARLLAEFVQRNQVGQTFVSGDPASFADAVKGLLAAPPTSAHIESVAQQYSWQGVEGEVLDLYDDLTGWSSQRPTDDVIDLDVRALETGDES